MTPDAPSCFSRHPGSGRSDTSVGNLGDVSGSVPASISPGLPPVVPVKSLTRHTDRFACEPYHATLTVRTCLSRQDAQIEGRGRTKALYPLCAGCPTGVQVALQLAGTEDDHAALGHVTAPERRTVEQVDAGIPSVPAPVKIRAVRTIKPPRVQRDKVTVPRTKVMCTACGVQPLPRKHPRTRPEHQGLCMACRPVPTPEPVAPLPPLEPCAVPGCTGLRLRGAADPAMLCLCQKHRQRVMERRCRVRRATGATLSVVEEVAYLLNPSGPKYRRSGVKRPLCTCCGTRPKGKIFKQTRADEHDWCWVCRRSARDRRNTELGVLARAKSIARCLRREAADQPAAVRQAAETAAVAMENVAHVLNSARCTPVDTAQRVA